MKSLFEKEEKENQISQLKIDLISRFYPFTNEEIIEYKRALNLDRYHLMNNESIQWDTKLIDDLNETLDWSAIWKLKNITFDYNFIKKYENKIDFNSFHLSKNIEWSDKIISDYGDRFDWSKWLITKKPLATTENLRRFKDKLDWGIVSEKINFDFNDSIIKEFADYWDWKKLSSNTNIPFELCFFSKYLRNFDFVNLSHNPRCIKLIYKYPDFKIWIWGKVVSNSGIKYNEESFNFIFYYFKKKFLPKWSEIKNINEDPLYTFFSFLFIPSQFNDLNYFYKDEFADYFPWDRVCKYSHVKLPLSFIEKNKEKINFKERNFLSNHKDVLTLDFIKNNIERFDIYKNDFYRLAINYEFLCTLPDENIDWFSLSGNTYFDWSWQFIDKYISKMNVSNLTYNETIYNNLILNQMSKKEIFDFLKNELDKRNFKNKTI